MGSRDSEESIFEVQYHEIGCVRGPMWEKGKVISGHGVYEYYGLIKVSKILD